MRIFSAYLAPGLGLSSHFLRTYRYLGCILLMRYISPLGVEHGDLRELCLLSDESLVLRCKTPSVRSSETCLVLATHPPLVCPCPNHRNRNPPDSVSSKILPENILVSQPRYRLPSSVFSALRISFFFNTFIFKNH